MGLCCARCWHVFETVHLCVYCRVAVLDKVTDFLLFLGKILISGSVGAYLSVSITNFRCQWRMKGLDFWSTDLINQ